MNAPVPDRASVATVPAKLVGLLGLVPASLQPDIRRTAADLRVTLELSDAIGVVVARIESRCPEIVLVDTDLLGCPEGLRCRVRSWRADVRLVALTCFWSEREEMLRTCVDAVVHKPIRDGEWRDLLERLSDTDSVPAALRRTPHLAA